MDAVTIEAIKWVGGFLATFFVIQTAAIGFLGRLWMMKTDASIQDLDAEKASVKELNRIDKDLREIRLDSNRHFNDLEKTLDYKFKNLYERLEANNEKWQKRMDDQSDKWQQSLLDFYREQLGK